MSKESKLLEYYYHSTLDSQIASIDIKKISKDRSFDYETDINDIDILKNIFNLLKPSVKDEEISYVDVLIAPFVIENRSQRSYKEKNFKQYPFWIEARISDEGAFVLQPQLNNKSAFDRRALSPFVGNSDSGLILSSIEKVDAVQNKHIYNCESWQAYWDSCLTFFKEVVGEEWNKLSDDEFVVKNEISIVEAEASDFSKHILELYKNLSSKRTYPKLLNTLLSLDNVADKVIPDNDDIFFMKSHYGQFSNEFSLSTSQRKALCLYEREGYYSISAVNGPPGTGKTTLLQSVVANSIVKSAIIGKEPFKLIASSTNNKAISNILDSFNNNAGGLERWIPNLSSLGIYMASKVEEYDYLLVDNRNILSGTYLDNFHKADNDSFSQYFISCFKKQYNGSLLTTVEEIKDFLSVEINDLAQRIDFILDIGKSINEFEREWDSLANLKSCIEKEKNSLSALKEMRSLVPAYLDSYEIFLKKNKYLKFFSFLPFLKKRFLVEWNYFLSKSPVEEAKSMKSTFALREFLYNKIVDLDNEEKEIEAIISLHIELYERMKVLYIKDVDNKSFLETAWQNYINSKPLEYRDKILKEYETSSFAERRNRVLDISLRYDIFIASLHYWEGRWLIAESEDRIENTKGWNRKKIYSRMSYLTPLFISTFSTLPKFCYRTEANTFKLLPFYELFDQLIVDEAGQVGIEKALPSFSLAKKALVVGDVDQLEPIWSVYPSADLGNLQKLGLLEKYSFSEYKEMGLLCSSGSLMSIARKVSSYVDGKGSRGVMLTEHRRCADEIVEFSNRFVYSGDLEPMVGKLDSVTYKIEDEELIITPLAYVNIRGKASERQGSSCNVSEAIAIVCWIKKYGGAFQEENRGKELSEILAVITPFAAQRDMIKVLIKKEGLDTNITVGTVHSLQGAEKNIVLFSPTYGYDYKGKMFFDSGFNMLNVALTRAKKHFIVFGNMNLFKANRINLPSGALASILFRDERNELSSSFYYSTLGDSSNRINSLDRHRKAIAYVFSSAKKRIGIVSPFISSKAIEKDGIVEKIVKAVSAGVEVVIYTDNSLDGINGKLKDNTKRGRQMLEAANARLEIVEGIHNKALFFDDDMLIEGSFNWLSAVREGMGIRHEVSHIVKNEEAKKYIQSLIIEMEGCSK